MTRRNETKDVMRWYEKSGRLWYNGAVQHDAMFYFFNSQTKEEVKNIIADLGNGVTQPGL